MEISKIFSNTVWGLCFVVLAAAPVQAGFWESVGGLLGDLGGEASSDPARSDSMLGNEQIAAGFKEALTLGFKKAVNSTGAVDGFWSNPRIRIPEPAALQKAATLLEQVGLTREVDDFRYTMNQAASQAAGEAIPFCLLPFRR